MTFNSRRAQELGKWAESMGRGDRFHDAMFKAYFANGLNIAEPAVLRDVAGSVGLDPDEAEAVVLGGRFADAVDQDWDYSRHSGVTAVPTFVAGFQRIVGAQPYNTLARLLVEAGAEPR